jgi:nitrite reductase/ring-hydroxylating ferredoxin subunit
MGRFFARLIAAQDAWARLVGDFNHRWLSALFRPIKDLLSGLWLGHPLHPAITDIPLGTLLLSVVFDLLGQPAAADIALVATILFMLTSAVTGSPDCVDTDGSVRAGVTVHSSLMIIALALVLASVALRAGDPLDRSIPTGLSIVGLLVAVAGAYVGGDAVFVSGNMVSRHAFRGAGARWIKLDTGDLVDLTTLAEAAPVKARAGINDLVPVRIGETIHALHAVCAHAGGPLHQGKVVDGCLQCPWHGARYRLTDGRVRRGPALYDQSVYEIRATEAGGYEVRRSGS